VSSKPRLLLFELNEFNRELLEEAARVYEYENILKLIQLNESVTHTNDTYDSDFLEPWVQWVSIHTGTPASEHQVKHLGDVPELKHPQIWEKLSRTGVTSGVWGVLNGSRGNSPQCKFFVPDPWTFSEEATPPELNGLLQLPRYMARNRLNISGIEFVKGALKLLKTVAGPTTLKEMAVHTPKVMRMMARHPKSEFVGFCFIEYLSGLLFLEYFKKQNPQLGILFVNQIAHIQHYYWQGTDYENNEKIRYCLYFVDRLTERVFDSLEEQDRLVVINGLSQMNTNHEEPWLAYRPEDHNEFLKAAGLNLRSVEPLMSYDALIFFDSEEDCAAGKKILEEATVNGKGLFLVENYKGNPSKLFYRFQFYDPVDASAKCSINGRECEFGLYFRKIAPRTGRHIQHATLFSNDSKLPEEMKNHEVFDYICDFFAVESQAGAQGDATEAVVGETA
jgi:hypothetical protein